jgi:ADP-heptose:LPS heptosyltransferase
VCRLDNVGDVLLSGPLVRAVAAGAERVTYLASPQGSPAAHLLPGVDRVLTRRAPWIDAEPQPVRREEIDRWVDELAGLAVDEAIVLTSFHQSPLPLALLLRMAGVGRIGATSVDYPGSLLDVRHTISDDVHEVRRALDLGEALGHRLPPGDDGRLRIVESALPPPASHALAAPSLVVHPGASVTARAWSPDHCAEAVERLTDDGWQVLVTGSAGEADLTQRVAGRRGVDLGGRLDLPGLAATVAAAAAIVVGNTGPAHLAAAVGTPVVSVFAPTVPARRWAPWMVPHVLLGHQHIACAGCRARTCPVPGHPCVDTVGAGAVAGAVRALVGGPGEAPTGAAAGEASALTPAGRP